MQYKKKIEAHVEERITHSRTTCDFCKKDIKPISYEDASEVTLLAELGDIWPEGDCRESERFDCCPQCWKEKVRPALEALAGTNAFEFATEEGDTKHTPWDDWCAPKDERS